MNTISYKPPVWFWIVTVIALLWNLGGVIAFVMQVTASPESIPENERELYSAIPKLIIVAFAVGSIGSVLGNILLLIRKKLATVILLISLGGILIQMSYVLFVSETIQIHGPTSVILPCTIIVVGIILVWFSRHAEAKGWIK